MKYTSLKKGFTLIELLVVITIIGILATGAVTVYTSQIQKARDTARVNDIKALQSAVEQVYQDASEYPQADALHTDIVVYLPSFPKDAKNGKTCAGSGTALDCWYIYNAGSDVNGIAFGSYEISTAFENKWNVDSKAADSTDNGSDDLRLEIWLLTDGPSGQINTVSTGVDIPEALVWVCDVAWGTPATSGIVKVVIAGKSSDTDGCG